MLGHLLAGRLGLGKADAPARGSGREDIGIIFAAAATELLGQAGEEFLEGAEIGGTAEEVVEDFVPDVAHQGGEKIVSLRFVFDKRVLLGKLAEVDAIPEGIHVVEVLLPESVDGIEEDVALQAFEGFRILSVGLQFVGGLDLLGDPGGVAFSIPGFEGGGFLGEAQWEGQVEPLQEAIKIGGAFDGIVNSATLSGMASSMVSRISPWGSSVRSDSLRKV